MDAGAPRLEFFVEPLAEGRPGPHVKAAIDAAASRELAIDVGPFGSVARGELDDLIEAAGPLLRSALAAGADRISVHLSRGPDLEGPARAGSLHDALPRMITEVEHDLGAPIGHWSREDKQAAVRMLDARGAFLLRRAVEAVADAMGVSRITIYNYLNAGKGE
jgi:uncharacterized protein YqgV (UPF0045/DUF77 family)